MKRDAPADQSKARRERMNMDSLLDYALAYHRRGWCIIPMRSEAKRPAVSWKSFQTEAPPEAKLQTWFGNGKCYGIGVIFGAVSGDLAERDFDTMESYERWSAEHPELAATLPTVETRRGRRVMFTAAQGSIAKLRETLGKPDGTGAISCGDGELRAGVGCYSVLPPSIHPSGHVYRWLVPLPDGVLPIIDDVVAAGLWACNREYRRHEEGREVESVLNETLNNVATSLPSPHSCLQVSLESLDSLLHGKVMQAIERTIPTSGGKRHLAIFAFARELRALPEFANVPPQALRSIVREWHNKALSYIRTAFEENWLDFCEGWDKVKYPKGKGPLDLAFQKALAADVPEVARQYQKQLRLLVALCRELQRANSPKPFYLASRAAGRLLGVSHVHASRWLRILRLDDILRLVKPGSDKTGVASRYLYLGPI